VVPPVPTSGPPEAPPSDDAEPVRSQAQIDADAELCAIMYFDRPAYIRAAGGLPPCLDCRPPKPEIVAGRQRVRARA
jgi:hypothetical protein